MAKNYLVNYWDGKTEHLVDFGGNVNGKKKGKAIHYIKFAEKHPDFEIFLSDTFDYSMTDLASESDARFVVNLYFYWKLEQELNK